MLLPVTFRVLFPSGTGQINLIIFTLSLNDFADTNMLYSKALLLWPPRLLLTCSCCCLVLQWWHRSLRRRTTRRRSLPRRARSSVFAHSLLSHVAVWQLPFWEAELQMLPSVCRQECARVGGRPAAGAALVRDGVRSWHPTRQRYEFSHDSRLARCFTCVHCLPAPVVPGLAAFGALMLPHLALGFVLLVMLCCAANRLL